VNEREYSEKVIMQVLQYPNAGSTSSDHSGLNRVCSKRRGENKRVWVNTTEEMIQTDQIP
jgi:hypothetical protein